MENRRTRAYKKQKILLNLISRLNDAEKPEDILSALAPQEVDLLSPEELKGPISLALEQLRFLKSAEQVSHEWRLTFDAITDPISITDENYRIVKANKEWARLAGEDFKKVKGRFCYDLLHHSQTPCPNCNSNPANIKIGKHDFLSWTYPIKGIAEKLFVHYYRDVSLERRLYRTLIEKQKLSLIGKLTEGISQELAVPLDTMIRHANSLLTIIPPEETRNEFLVDIKEALERCRNIMLNLRDYSTRNDAEKNARPIDLNHLINKTLLLAESAFNRIKVVRELSEDVGEIKGNSVKLQQAFFNIIMNAVQAMSLTGGSLTITTKRISDKTVQATFSDTGVGMNKETVAKIFEPFYTTKSKQGGTGLGLYLTREIVSAHKGKIDLSSEPGRGTIIKINLPKT